MMVQPLKWATPAVVVAVQPDRAPRPEAFVRVMAFVSLVTVLPPASSMATTGCVTKALPPMALLGSVVKARWVAGPVPTENGALVVPVSVPSVATSS